ncbi:GNAT family N-acetyltransferase [Pleomorphovibrio marinus]|uniref:GNAT family N-acetyltransferase n=1 Tax=Pleomorphovibrio marinus TaxID=2164132 RepID=UPI000E0A51EB|nr:GNAT family protein [Pleomorphovibrio marinus]
MKFLPIEIEEGLNTQFMDIPECGIILEVFKEHYRKVGFVKPWIAFFVCNDYHEIIGAAGFKGQPKNGMVEISYGTFKKFEGQGMGTAICKQLVSLALQTVPSLIINARTLPQNVASIKVLERNGFKLIGTVYDEEDGNVLEWTFMNPSVPK